MIYEKEEKHGIAEKTGLEKGYIRNVAVQESFELVKNMKAGVYELQKKLSNPRRVSCIYHEVFEKLSFISNAIKEANMDTPDLFAKFHDVLLPAVIFYSLARNIHINQFWDICAEDFSDFYEKILDTINEMSMHMDDSDPEMKGYRLLVYYYFSTRFQANKNRCKEFEKFYTSPNIIKILKE